MNEIFAYLKLPILVANDANAGAFAERWWNQYHKDFLYLKIGTGIGAGIISDGKMLYGHQGMVGEIGHLPIPSSTDLCRCGQRGCLEATIGRKALKHKNLPQKERVEFIVKNLSFALSPLIYALNPRKIIIWGDVTPQITQALEGKLTAQTQWPSIKEITVEISTLGKNAIALGACSIIMHHIFQHPGLIAKSNH